MLLERAMSCTIRRSNKTADMALYTTPVVAIQQPWLQRLRVLLSRRMKKPRSSSPCDLSRIHLSREIRVIKSKFFYFSFLHICYICCMGKREREEVIMETRICNEWKIWMKLRLFRTRTNIFFFLPFFIFNFREELNRIEKCWFR